MLKSWFGFGDLDLFFKVTAGLKLQNLSQKHNISCPEHSLFGFDLIFMKGADNLDRLKISDGLQFWQDCFIHFGGTCPCVPK